MPEDLLDRVDAGLAKGEGALLVVTIFAMVGLSAVQLFLRKFFDYGFEWADVLVRQMVLWVGFLGGARATYEGRHIAIDAVNKLLPPARAALLRVVTSLTAAGITGVMVWAAWVYLQDEIEIEATLIGEIPAWPFRAIVPLCLALITFHFVVGARNSALVALGRRAPSEGLAEASEGEESAA